MAKDMEMTTEPKASPTTPYESEAMNTPENAQEMARRITVALGVNFEMYHSVHRTLFAAVIEVCIAPWEQREDEQEYVVLDHDAIAGTGNYGAFLRRRIPDIAIAGVATAVSDDRIISDFTLTGTLPDGPLHLHSEATLILREGRVVQYRVRQNPAEMQRFLKATGDPYKGGGIAAVELKV
jgi:hypothetical protein